MPKITLKSAKAAKLKSIPPLAVGLRFSVDLIPPKLWIVWVDDAWFHGLDTANKRCVFAREQNADAKTTNGRLKVSGRNDFHIFGGQQNSPEKYFAVCEHWNLVECDWEPPHNDHPDGILLKTVVNALSAERLAGPVGLVLTNFEGYVKWRDDFLFSNEDTFVIFDIKHQAGRNRMLTKSVTSCFRELARLAEAPLSWENLGIALTVDAMYRLSDDGKQSAIPFRLCLFTSASGGSATPEAKDPIKELGLFLQAMNAEIGKENANHDKLSKPKLALFPRIWQKDLDSFKPSYDEQVAEDLAYDILRHACQLWHYKFDAWKMGARQVDITAHSGGMEMEYLLDSYWSSLQGPSDSRDHVLNCRRAAESALTRRDAGLLESTVAGFSIQIGLGAGELSDVATIVEQRGFFRISSPWILPLGSASEFTSNTSDVALRQMEKKIGHFTGVLILIVNLNQEQFGAPDELINLERLLAQSIDIVRRFRLRFPQLTIVIETAHHGHRAEEAFYRAGANAVYHLPGSADVRSALDSNELDHEGRRLFSDYWSHHQSLYQVPDCLGLSTRDFVDCSAPDWKREHDSLMEKLGHAKLQTSDRRIQEVRRLLRALFPKSHSLRIVKVLRGGGTEGVPFVVAERDARGHESRPVQVKLHPDWRAIDAERRGFDDVIARRLGPSIAHVVNGPFRVGAWSGMVQSFAAREDSGPESGSAPCSLEETLTNELAHVGEPRKLAGDLFRQLLIPLYGKGEKKGFPVLRLLSKQGPAILQAEFVTQSKNATSFDFRSEVLSRKHQRHRACCAAREWRRLLGDTVVANEGRTLDVRGWRLETLEEVSGSANGRRARFTDEASGLKIDVVTTNRDHAEQAKALIDSPLPLRGLRPRLKVKAAEGWQKNFKSECNPWSGLRGELASLGVIPAPELNACGGLDPFAWLWVARPLDWHESFRLGPVHGDLNLGNALVTSHDGARVFSMIDFDQAENDFPIAFDLAKLEWESLTKIGWKRIGVLHDRLREMAKQVGKHEVSLPELAAGIERAIVADLDGGIEGLLHRMGLPELCLEGDSLCKELNGYLEWRRAVAVEGEKLGADRRQRLNALFAYGFASLKFKNLRDDAKTGRGAMPAQIALYSLQALILELDKLDGLAPLEQDGGHERSTPLEKSASEWIDALRRLEATDNSNRIPLIRSLMGLKAGNASLMVVFWKTVLETFVAKHHPGGGRWMREILWHIRDRRDGKLGSEAEAAAFTLAMVWVSEFPSEEKFLGFKEKLQKRFEVTMGKDEWKQFHDFASTGRLGNIFPTGCFFKELAKAEGRRNVIKISSRGESGGTVDLLEAAGLTLAESYDAVELALEENRGDEGLSWAMAAPGSNLCAVDKVLMGLRKESECMGCGDLVIASIIAKKLCVGITSFDLELVTGWDSKFEVLRDSDNDKKQLDVAIRWKNVWNALEKALSSEGEVTLRTLHFYSSDSDKAEWIWKSVDGSPELKIDDPKLSFAVGRMWLAVGAMLKFQPKTVEKLEKAFSDPLNEAKSLGEALGAYTVERAGGNASPCMTHGLLKWWLWSKTDEFLDTVSKLSEQKSLISRFQGTSALLFRWEEERPLDTQFLDGFYSTRLSAPVHPWAGMSMWRDEENKNYCLVVAPESGREELETLAWEFALGAFWVEEITPLG